jgi:hypothetical protein
MRITANHESILSSALALGSVPVTRAYDPDLDDLIREGYLDEVHRYNGRSTITTAVITDEGRDALHERECRRARLSREWARRHAR